MGKIIAFRKTLKWKSILVVCVISVTIIFFIIDRNNFKKTPQILSNSNERKTTLANNIVFNRTITKYHVDNKTTSLHSFLDFEHKNTSKLYSTMVPIQDGGGEQSIQNIVKKLSKESKQTLLNVLVKELELDVDEYNTRIKPEDNKTILFWGKWFGGDLSAGFGDYNHLKEQNCPSWQCNFTYDRATIKTAAAIIFHAEFVHDAYTLRRPSPHQRWVFLDLESPQTAKDLGYFNTIDKRGSGIFNWTMTYHSKADIGSFFGHLMPINYTKSPIRLDAMDYDSEPMKAYIRSLHNGDTLEDHMGLGWITFVRRPHLAAWMSGHCPTYSKREEYVKELQKYVEIATYGSCGTEKCKRRHPTEPWCWVNKLAPNYLFYFSMENTLCDDYVTEKLYNPLLYGLVPVVYGGSNYSRFLPPHSYIDALQYQPKDLAELLLKLQKDPVSYGRYHLWRKFWEVKMMGSLCELCHRLHVDKTFKHYDNIHSWRDKTGQCFSPKNITEAIRWRNKIKVS